MLSTHDTVALLNRLHGDLGSWHKVAGLLGVNVGLAYRVAMGDSRSPTVRRAAARLKDVEPVKDGMRLEEFGKQFRRDLDNHLASQWARVRYQLTYFGPDAVSTLIRAWVRFCREVVG